jgi:tRNA-Thr(GGU) m(6)t(6)A37 methyltransferase TsaA
MAQDQREPREGEKALGFDPGAVPDAGVRFIGQIRSPWADRGDCPRNLTRARERGCEAWVELDEPYREGLLGLSEGQAVILLYWMDRARRDLIVQHPAHADGPRGTFALRSPVRPNTISLGVVRITALDRATGRIGIDAIDCLDGTPLLDIKPWLPGVDIPPGHGD